MSALTHSAYFKVLNCWLARWPSFILYNAWNIYSKNKYRLFYKVLPRSEQISFLDVQYKWIFNILIVAPQSVRERKCERDYLERWLCTIL